MVAGPWISLVTRGRRSSSRKTTKEGNFFLLWTEKNETHQAERSLDFQDRRDDSSMETMISRKKTGWEATVKSLCWDLYALERISCWDIRSHLRYKPESCVLRLMRRKIHIEAIDSMWDRKRRRNTKGCAETQQEKDSNWDIASVIRLPSQVYMQRHNTKKEAKESKDFVYMFLQWITF